MQFIHDLKRSWYSCIIKIKSNMDIFDFELTQDEILQIRALDAGKGSHDPDAPGVGEMLLNAFDVHTND